MPGIVGLISQRPSLECEAIVGAMLATIDRENFYCSGMESASELGVFAGWSAHEKSFAASQPFRSRDGNVIILCSGECFRESRSAAADNHSSSSDNSGRWLADQYQEFGDGMLERLNGTFSGLLIDKPKGRVCLFNDRYGAERIYWHETGDAFYFASEAKALLCVLPQLREFDVKGVAQFLDFGCTLQCRTLFRGIQRLPEASAWTFDRLQKRKTTYFSPEDWESQSKLTAGECAVELELLFKKLLPRYFVADSRPGVSLTGGLDSRLIMACLPEMNTRPISYTFSGAGRDTLDASVAADVAKARHVEHQVIRLGEDFFGNFQSLADATVYISDGTLGISGAHELYLNRVARMLSPIRITGVFGGELMRGVSFFKPIGLASCLLSHDVHASVDQIAHDGDHRRIHPVSFAAFHEIPQRRFAVPAIARSQLVFRTPYLDNEFVAFAYRMPADVQSNTALIETVITRRCPACARISTDRGHLGAPGYLARLLRRAAAEVTFKLDYYYSEGLPKAVSAVGPMFRAATNATGTAGLHKFLTYRNWFGNKLASYVQDALIEVQDQNTGLFNRDIIRKVEEDHRRGRDHNLPLINAILTLSSVERLLLSKECFPQDRPHAGSSPRPQLCSPTDKRG